MKVVILLVISSLFFTTLIFAGEDEAPTRFLDLKPAAIPAEKQASGFTMQKEGCKNGLYYSRSFDKCVISSNTTSIEKSKREVDTLRETKNSKQRGKVIYDAKKIGTTQPQPEQTPEQTDGTP
jgi:hypothetical protein